MMSPIDSRVLDANAEALGTPVSTLMDNAGHSISELLNERYPGKRILFVCGPGNNGGDGFAAALNMDPSLVRVALLRKPSSIHSNISRDRYSLLECPICEYDPNCMEEADVIVDCALGTGASGIIKDPYRGFVMDANASGKDIVSVDVPSGFYTDVMIKPKITITFHDMKNGMNEDCCGEIIVSDIGIPEEASSIVGPGDMLRYPVPESGSHKGDNGKVMLISGGPYFGAPIMASMAALRSGADIVRVFTPQSSAAVVSAYNPVLMVTPLPGDHLTKESVDPLLQESEKYDAILIGPGLGISEDTADAVRMFTERCRKPMVIDADGLNAVSGMRFEVPSVLTPHRREFERLGGDEPSHVAERMNATVLLKGSVDIITDGTACRTNRTGTPAMTGAGTGDVLAGIVSALLSKGMSAFDAAALASYVCGKAGELCFERRSYGMIATDLIDAIPSVLKNGLK